MRVSLPVLLLATISWAEQKPPAARAPAREETIDSIIDKANHEAPPAKEPAAPPPTDDNDNSPEAARPVALQTVKPVKQARTIGPYELGPLDCRMLDGAGIERLLPRKMMTGEEPDLLCRIVVTQPATVASATHDLTLSVFLGGKPSYQQARRVRIGSAGRRALVYVVPAERLSAEDAVHVTVRASLSGLAKPAAREVKFSIEPAD